MGVGILKSSNPCAHSLSICSSLAVGKLISPYPCALSQSIWSSMANLESSRPCAHSPSICSSMCVEILIASYLRGHCQFEVPCGCEFWYNLALVDFPCQFEVPWGWDLRKKHALVHIPRKTLVHTARQFEIPWVLENWYHLALVHTPCQFEVLLTWIFWYHLAISCSCSHFLSICSSMGVGILISSYPCAHPASIWSSMGVGILKSSCPCAHSLSICRSWGWENWHHLTYPDLPLCTFPVNLKFHGGGIWYHLTLVHTPCQFEVPRGRRIAQLGLRNFACTTPRMAQLSGLRNSTTTVPPAVVAQSGEVSEVAKAEKANFVQHLVNNGCTMLHPRWL